MNADNDFEKYFFKLMINSVYAKTMDAELLFTDRQSYL